MMNPNDGVRVMHPRLPAAVAAFIDAVNRGDQAAVVGSFARHALVNDQLREYWDHAAIADWAARDVIGPRLALRVRDVVLNRAHTVVEAELEGEFDKRGLPEPLVVTFYFSSHDDRLVQLIILRNEPDARTL